MLTEFLATYQIFLKENPYIAGVLSLYSLGIVTWFLRDVPKRLWTLALYQSTTSLTLLSSGAGSADMQYFSFLRWFRERGFMEYSRSLAVENTWRNSEEDRDGQLTAGDGRHFFIWKRRLCWLTKVRLEQGGTTNEITYSLKLTMLGRNHSKVLAALDEFRWRQLDDESYLYYPTTTGEWNASRMVSPRKIETVILNHDLKEKILGNVEWFLNNKQWYVDRGLPYRLVLLLYGPPGTGKSSLLRALASHFKRNLCPVNLMSYTDDQLGQVFRSVPDTSLIVIEDCDSCQAILKPEFITAETNVKSLLKLTRTGVLQALDGIDTLDGQIIILTTNYLERIEPSIIREERVNEKYYLGPLLNDSIHEYIDRMFPNEHVLTELKFAPQVGSVLQRFYKMHHQNYRDFIATIPVLNPDVVSESTKEIV